MAKEVLEMEVKTNIGKVTKDQKGFNKELKKTKETIEDVNAEGKETIAEMQVLGLSINGLKAGWKSAASGAKFLFSSIKLGIASTGVGILLLAFGALATWFATTKKGAEFLSIAFKATGAAISVIVDRIAKFGGGIKKLFSGDIRAGLSDMGDSFKGIGAEIIADTLLAIGLERSLQKLTDSQRALNVETAQRRADIEELKLIAEDVTKSEKERLDAAEKAFDIETDLLERRIANAKEAVRIEKVRLSLVLDPEADALDILAQKEIELANIRGESITKQIELNNKINAIKLETINNNKIIAEQNEAEIKSTEDLLYQLAVLRQDDEKAKEFMALQNEKRIARETAMMVQDAEERAIQLDTINSIYSLKYIELIDKQNNIEIDGNKKVLTSEEIVAKAKKDIRAANLNNVSAGINLAKSLAGENKAIQAGLLIAESATGIAKTIISTQAANAGALATPQSILTSGAAAVPVIAANNISAGISIAATIAATSKGLSALGGGGAPSGSNPSGGGGGGGSSTPAPQMMSGAFDMTGGAAPEPIKAFVLTDEMSNSQNQLANIRRRATI